MVRDSYRQFYWAKAAKRRIDCYGLSRPVDVNLTRNLYLHTNNPLHQSILRHVLTGSLDHAHRLYKSNLTDTPLCPFCSASDETAEHIFWFCDQWRYIRTKYPTLMRLFSLTGTQCFLHCGWVEQDFPYGFHLLDSIEIQYSLTNFTHDAQHMFLDILLARHLATQVLHSTPLTPPQSPVSPQTILSSPSSCVQLPGDVSPFSDSGWNNLRSQSPECQKILFLIIFIFLLMQFRFRYTWILISNILRR